MAEAQVIVERCAAGEALPHLSRAVNGYDALYADQIACGQVEAWRINNGESYALTRVESDPTMTPPYELVLCAYEGRDLLGFIAHMKRCAVGRFARVRCHVQRRGFERIARMTGFKKLEVVYGLEIQK